MGVKRVSAVLAVIAFACLANASPAAACSCAPDKKPTLQRFDAAATMRLVDVRNDNNPSGSADLTYRILRVYKGSGRYNLREGEKLRIHSPQGAACGLPRKQGRRYGLRMHETRNGLSSNLCVLLTPEELRKAAKRSGNARSAAATGCGSTS